MRIQRLIVIAGPSAIGKSTLMRRLIAGRYSWLSPLLGIKDSNEFTWLDPAKDLRNLSVSGSSGVVVHYDIIKRSIYDLFPITYKEDRVFQSIMKCPQICWLTLWATPEVLLRRVQDRKNRTAVSQNGSWSLKSLHDLRVIDRRTYIYSDPSRVQKFYDAWAEAIVTNRYNEHFMINVNDLNRPTLMP